jgi:hypothetical protein
MNYNPPSVVASNSECVVKQSSAKISKVYSSSLGNKYKIQQQTRYQDGNIIPATPVSVLSDEAILKLFDSLKNCCAMGGSIGCWKQCFSSKQSSSNIVSTDYNGAITCFRSHRDKTRFKTDFEMDHFIQQLFVDSIVDVRLRDTDQKKQFTMDYKLVTTQKVCKKAIATAYGFSVKRLELCSSSYKIAETKVHSLNTVSYKDDHVPDYTFQGIKEIFQSNLDVSGVGNIYCIV